MQRGAGVAWSVGSEGASPGRLAGLVPGDSHWWHLAWVLAGPSRGELSTLHLMREGGHGARLLWDVLAFSYWLGRGHEHIAYSESL